MSKDKLNAPPCKCPACVEVDDTGYIVFPFNAPNKHIITSDHNFCNGRATNNKRCNACRPDQFDRNGQCYGFQLWGGYKKRGRAGEGKEGKDDSILPIPPPIPEFHNIANYTAALEKNIEGQGLQSRAVLIKNITPRKCPIMAICNIALNDAEVVKGLFKHKRLIAGLVEILGQKGVEHEEARRDAVEAINNIANGADDDVKAGLFHFPELMSHIEAIIGDVNLNGTYTKDMALSLKYKIEHMGGGGQSNPPSTQSSGSITAESVRMENELAMVRTELATMKSNLDTVRTDQAAMRIEQAAMKSSLTCIQDSLCRFEKALATITSTLAPTEILDLTNDISTTLSNPPSPTDSTCNKKRSNLAILVDNQASFNHTLKKVKKEKDDALEALEDTVACTVCLAEKRSVLFLPCGHLVCCEGCSERVDDCPMCRKVIRERKTVFM